MMFTYFKNQKCEKRQSNHCPQLTCTQKHSTLVISGGITHWTTDIKLRTHTSAVEVFQTNQCTALSLCQLNTVACHVPLLIICVGETKANGVPPTLRWGYPVGIYQYHDFLLLAAATKLREGGVTYNVCGGKNWTWQPTHQNCLHWNCVTYKLSSIFMMLNAISHKTTDSIDFTCMASF